MQKVDIGGFGVRTEIVVSRLLLFVETDVRRLEQFAFVIAFESALLALLGQQNAIFY